MDRANAVLTEIIMENKVDKIKERINKALNGIRPRPRIGDDDSIYLTPVQEGMINGLKLAIQIINEENK